MHRLGLVTRVAVIVTTLAFAIGIAIKRRACAELAHKNEALRAQLEQMDVLTTENQRLSNLAARKGARSGVSESRGAPGLAENQAAELVRLGGELDALREKCQEIESLREDTRKVRSAIRTRINARATGPEGNRGEGGMNGTQFELLRAEYGTTRTNLDVTQELADRIRGDRLKAVASNNLRGDPEFGQVKNLTVIYRVSGVTRTNRYREGDVVILPAD